MEKEVIEKDDKEQIPSNELGAKLALAILLVMSYATLPRPLHPPIGEAPSVLHVWYYGWITAVSTGLGVLPLVFVPDLDKFWIGVANAVASGMMVAASYSLFVEGCTFSDAADDSTLSSSTRTLTGTALGLAFILLTKSFLDTHEDLKVGTLQHADARKVLLIIFVMTLHSFSEGVGIGVSFGGEHGSGLGVFISASLAVHNVPEGLAVAIVLLPRNVPKLTAAMWCVLTSLPQPLMAVPAFLFVEKFVPILPVGLGFAGGAMAWVAVFELMVEAYEDAGLVVTGVVSVLSLGAMTWLQGLIDGEARG